MTKSILYRDHLSSLDNSKAAWLPAQISLWNEVTSTGETICFKLYNEQRRILKPQPNTQHYKHCWSNRAFLILYVPQQTWMTELNSSLQSKAMMMTILYNFEQIIHIPTFQQIRVIYLTFWLIHFKQVSRVWEPQEKVGKYCSANIVFVHFTNYHNI